MFLLIKKKFKINSIKKYLLTIFEIDKIIKK